MSHETVEVSVVIPTNKVDKWLDLAAESVLSQSGADFELVVLFDGMDKVPDLAWVSDDRVRTMLNPRSTGVGAALGKACLQARGEFIARLDADDIASPGRLAIQLKALKSDPGLIAVSGLVDWIDEEGLVVGAFGHKPLLDARRKLLEQNVLVQSAMMFRRSGYESAGGYEPLVQMEDYDLWLRLARLGRMQILNQTVSQYRLHPHQTSRRTDFRAEYVRLIVSERNALASMLGASMLLQFFRNALWVGALSVVYVIPPWMFKLVRRITGR